MDAAVDDDPGGPLPALEDRIDDYDFFFLHGKGTDKAGEAATFDEKWTLSSEWTKFAALSGTGIGVTLITGDHSTPARMKSHSWYPAPFLLHGGPVRASKRGEGGFGESECARGVDRSDPGCELMPLASAGPGRLGKFGA